MLLLVQLVELLYQAIQKFCSESILNLEYNLSKIRKRKLVDKEVCFLNIYFEHYYCVTYFAFSSLPFILYAILIERKKTHEDEKRKSMKNKEHMSSSLI